MRHTGRWWVAAVAAGLSLATLTSFAQQIHRHGFESQGPVWVKGAADANYREVAHKLADDHARSGQFSEYLQLQAEQGSHIHYTYDLGRAPVSDETNISVYVKANRPGLQLLARLVLPHMRNAGRLDEPLTTLVRGDVYDKAGRWQRLELRRVVKLVKEQQQLLRAELNKDVNLEGAYLDRLVLNVYGGLGLHEVWIDDLEAGPLTDSPFKITSRPAPRVDGQVLPTLPRRSLAVSLNRDHLVVGKERFFFRAIRHSDTPLETLRNAGFNTVWLPSNAPTPTIEEAVKLGFFVVPTLPVTEGDNRPRSADALQRDLTRYLDQDGLLFWDLGSGGLAAEQSRLVASAAQVVHAADPQRPLAADVWDGFQPYSRSVDLLGVHRWPLMTGLELAQYREWLQQRRQLASPGVFLWTWVQTHLPDWYCQQVYNQPASVGFQEPVGPQPEQIRLLTYTALSAGCRGLGFWSDRFLADSHQGRDRLLTVALLNQELQLLEPLLVSVEASAWIDTSVPQVKAAVLYTSRGVLVLPIWLGDGSQFVPGQAAVSQLTLTVPDVPITTSAWEVSPADVRSLRSERVAGGRRVTLSEFGLTSAIVFTSDNGTNGLLVRLQDQTRRMRKQAAQWTYALAETELEKVQRVQGQLEQAGHTTPDARQLLEKSQALLQSAANHWGNNNFRDCYLEGQRAVRPLRILMRAQWDQAVRNLDTPTASPYAVSFYTLPRHWALMEGEVGKGTPGASVLPDGGFEADATNPVAAWLPQEVKLDDVRGTAQRVGSEAGEGKQCLMLRIDPADAQRPPRALERTFLAMHSPTVRLPPGTLVRVSALVRVPQPITASTDGALLYDSAAGEPLAVRLTGATKWKKFTLYRRVPASGTMNVTLALTGLGTVYFDDVRIEPLTGGQPAAAGGAVKQAAAFEAPR